MRDVFKEQLVKRQPGLKSRMLKAAILAGALVVTFFVLMIPVLAVILPFLLVAIAFAAYFGFRHLNVEYEYILTNNEFDVDAIYGKSKRKRIFEGDVRDIEAFRPFGSREHEHSFSATAEKKDFTSGQGEGFYEFLIMQRGKRVRVAFEPNAEILTAIVPQLKRGVYKQ